MSPAAQVKEDERVVRMKEENLFHRRFSLCPNATSPPKIDPRTLTRNLSYGGDNDLYNLSPGSETDRDGLSMLSNELSPAQSPGSKVRTWLLIGQLLNSSH